MIDACAAMMDEELEAQMSNPGIIRNRNKIYSVRKNAQVVKQIQTEYGILFFDPVNALLKSLGHGNECVVHSLYEGVH